MNIKLYEDFIHKLINDGIEVHNLILIQISKSIELYKIIHR